MYRPRLLAPLAAGCAVAGAALLLAAFPAVAQITEPHRPLVGDQPATESASDLAKQIQNPVGDLISLPVLYNANLGFGPNRGTQSVAQVQPVVPFHVSDDWNVIARGILPVIWNPSLTPNASVSVGTGPSSITTFLSPRRSADGWLWGAGPAVQMPTLSSGTLGSSVWGAGPSGVIVRSTGPWVAGALVNNIWSLGGTGGPGGNRYSALLANPFVSYNFDGGWYLSTSPEITAHWHLSGEKWTLPVGGGGGRVVILGSLPIDISVNAYYHAIHPSFGPRWHIGTQLTFVF